VKPPARAAHLLVGLWLITATLSAVVQEQAAPVAARRAVDPKISWNKLFGRRPTIFGKSSAEPPCVIS